MSWKFTNKAAILVASEGGSYGAPPALDAVNYKGLVIYDPQIRPAAENIQRDPVRSSFTPVAPLVGRKSVEISFATELKGTGDSANPDGATVLHTLLKACAMKDASLDWGDGTACASIWWCELAAGTTQNASAVAPYQSLWVVEDPAGAPADIKAVVIGHVRRKASDTDTAADCVILACASPLDPSLAHEIQADAGGAPSGTALLTVASVSPGAALMPTSEYAVYHNNSVAIAGFYDNILHLAPGGIGTWSIELQDGQVPRISFTISALWNDPATSSVPAGVDLFSHLPPRACKEDLILAESAGTALGSLYKPNFSRFSLDMGNSVIPDKNLNAADCAGEFFIQNRQPKGGVDPAVDDLATFNPWSAWTAGSERVLALCLGSQDVGNRVALTLPKAVYSGMGYTDRDGRLTYQMEITPTGVSDDEFVMIFG